MNENRTHRQSMPSKTEIAYHWGMGNDYCWGCGFEAQIERCHLLARCKNGGVDVGNFVLLCKFCHNHIQEFWTDNVSEAEYIKKLIDNGLPFLDVRIAYAKAMYENNLIKTI